MGALLGLSVTLAALSAVASADPLPIVQRAVTAALAVLRPPEPTAGRLPGRALTPVERRAEVQRIAEELFDFEQIGERVLWRHWEERNAVERADFVRLFKALLARTYVGKLEKYSGQTITFLGTRMDGATATVMSRVVDGRTRESTTLDYRLHERDGRWLVHDIVIDGISFLSNYRTQFDRMIRDSSYEAMIQQLRLNVDPEGESVFASPRGDPPGR